jgi:hypothetical protein
MARLSPSPGEHGPGDLDGTSKEEADRYSRSFSCHFSPVVGVRTEYEELFRNEKVEGIIDVVIRRKYGILRFMRQSELDLFMGKFSGYMFKGQKMYLEKAEQSQGFSTTVHLSGFVPGSISERGVYEKFLHFGFIRRVSIKQDSGFVEFDTVDEAKNVVRQHRTIDVNGVSVKVAAGHNEPKFSDKEGPTIPLKELIPLDHPFWYRLQDMLWEGGAH